jgi:hypothetical protein
MPGWLLLIRPGLHLALHLLVPGAVARLFWPNNWRRAWLIMLAAMVIDLDHLLSDPMYDPNRCSLNSHPLHGVGPAMVYLLMLLPARTRILGCGLLVHLALDGADCLLMRQD